MRTESYTDSCIYGCSYLHSYSHHRRHEAVDVRDVPESVTEFQLAAPAQLLLVAMGTVDTTKGGVVKNGAFNGKNHTQIWETSSNGDIFMGISSINEGFNGNIWENSL